MMTSEILFINAKYQLERNYRIQHFIHLHLLSSLTPCPQTTEKKNNLRRFLKELFIHTHTLAQGPPT